VNVTVHYTRLSARGTTRYVERLVADDGARLTTTAAIAPEHQGRMAQAFLDQHLLPPEAPRLTGIRKHYFYREYFDVLAFFFAGGRLAGYYCDIVTPLRCEAGEYYLTDLFLDFWLRPGEPARGLDEDEFEAAVRAGAVTPDDARRARDTYRRLEREIALGIFPYRYIRA
jgi:predicted RNA-binding protein associated with RNAse of E/G family